MNFSPRLLVLLLLPPLLWASNAVLARVAIDSIGPLWLNALRWGLALLILLPAGWKLVADAESRAQVGERWIYLGILGLIGVGGYNGLQYLALRTSTPVNVTLIASSLPLWSMLAGVLFYRRAARARTIARCGALAGRRADRAFARRSRCVVAHPAGRGRSADGAGDRQLGDL
jgi:drug/metabolite transporter (DMT)-like permease